MTQQRTARACPAMAILMALLAAATIAGQEAGDVAQLRDQLRERYDVAALQDGVVLIPRQPTAAVRIVTVRDGVVEVNGETVTGRELRETLGNDADLVLRVTYLDAAGRQTLTAPASPQPPTPPVPAPTPGVAPPPAIPAPPPVPGAPPAPAARRQVRQGDVVRIGGSVNVARDEIIEGDVVAVLGSARIDGEVNGEVTVVMGSLNLGPNAVVRNDVTVVGGAVNRAPGARIEGSINNVAVGGRQWGMALPAMMRDSYVSRMGRLSATLLRVVLLALLVIVVVALGRTSVERIAERTAADPVRAGLVGFAAQVLFVPLLVITVVVLAISIVGIPLLALVPFGILLVLLVLLIGFSGVAYQVGRMLNDRFGWNQQSAYATVFLGVLVIASLTILARSAAVALGGIAGVPLGAVGYLIEYLAWTVGFGAAILAWLHDRDQRRRAAAITPNPGV